MRILFVSGVLLFATILTCGNFSHGQGAKDKQPDPTQALPHEGSGVNGLQLRVEAEFIPAESSSSSYPILEAEFTFLNKTNRPILLPGYTMYHQLSVSRVAPLANVEVKYHKQIMSPCWAEAPGPKHIITIPPNGKYVFRHCPWCDSLGISYGVSKNGRVVDSPLDQYFKLIKTGELTVAFVYRTSHPYARVEELSKFLKPGEKFWSGQVYSNPVKIVVSPPYKPEPVPPNYTGLWVDHYPSGKKWREAHYKNGKLDGRQVLYWPLGTKQSEEHFKDGILHGHYIRYHDQGWKELEDTYRQGKSIGPKIVRYPNGQKSLYQEIKNGKYERLHISWHPNGQKAAQLTYKNDKLEGPYLEWYENGQKMTESFYKNGKLEGLYTTWHENGQKEHEAFFKNDQVQGTPKRWDKNGNVKEFPF